jgi:hypothetical protein
MALRLCFLFGTLYLCPRFCGQNTYTWDARYGRLDTVHFLSLNRVQQRRFMEEKEKSELMSGEEVMFHYLTNVP